MEGAKARLITVCLFVCLSEILTALATRSKAIPNTVKEKNGLCSPRCGWYTEGHQMGQKWALSLEYFVARIARPLTFNTFYFCVWGGFVFVNFLVQRRCAETSGMNMADANCAMPWL